METKTFNEILEISQQGKEGLVFLGCGGDPQEWIDGINSILLAQQILHVSKDKEEDTKLEEVYKLETTGGRIDLCFMLNKKVYIGKLSIWRIQFGDCCWLSDYVVNYRSQHNG